ncbi:Gelsolin repeat protein [Entamoeba marina]
MESSKEEIPQTQQDNEIDENVIGDGNEEDEEWEYEEVEEEEEDGRIKKVGEKTQASKHEVTSQELTAGKKVIEALEKRRQAQYHEEELFKSLNDDEVEVIGDETIDDAKRRIVAEMIEKERRGSVFEDYDRAKEKKLISNMFDVDAAPYDTLFEVQWGMRSNSAAIRTTRGYIIDGVFPFLIDKEEEDSLHGVFCHKNTYLYITPGKSAETFNIFLWFGKLAPMSKRCICAMLASQLSVCLDNHAKHYFEEDGHESIMFKELFEDVGGLMYTNDGVTDDVVKKPRKPKRKLRLFKINEVCQNLSHVEQVETIYASLSPYDGFVFDDGKRVYMFSSKFCASRVKNRALQFAMALRAQCGYDECEIYMEPSPKMLLFYRALKLDDMSYDELSDYILKEYKKSTERPSFGLLMRFTHNTKTSQIVKTIKPDEIPLTTKMLKSHRCYIYDCQNEVFMWKGKNCSRKEWELLKLLATKVIMKMVQRPSWTRIQDEFEGKESEAFKYHIADWNYTSITIPDDDYQKHLELLSKEWIIMHWLLKKLMIQVKVLIKRRYMQLMVGKEQPIVYDYKWDFEQYNNGIQEMLLQKWVPTVITKEIVDHELKYNITETLELTDLAIFCFVDVQGPVVYRIPQENYGVFYDNNSYIISVEKWDYVKDIWRRDFYFWEGERTNSLYYGQFLKKNYPVLLDVYSKNKNRSNSLTSRQANENRIIFSQQRIKQGVEPKVFSSLFNHRIIVKNGNYKDTVAPVVDVEYSLDDEEYDYVDEDYDEDAEEEIVYYDEDGNVIEEGEGDGEWEYEYEEEGEEEEEEEEEIVEKKEEKEIKEDEGDEEEDIEENSEKEIKEESNIIIPHKFYEIMMKDRTQWITEKNILDISIGKNMESHRCFLLETLNAVYLWVGKKTDQISRIQAIRAVVDLFEGEKEFVCFEEGFHYNEFWDALHGIEESYLSLTNKELSVENPITFEITSSSQNFIGIGFDWLNADASIGDESVPLQQKYAIKVAYDYCEQRLKERNSTIDVVIESSGKESQGFKRIFGGNCIEQSHEDPRQSYYTRKLNEFNRIEEEEHGSRIENDIKINWESVDIDKFDKSMIESRSNDSIRKELLEQQEMKKEAIELLHKQWIDNAKLSETVKSFVDEDTDIESLPDEDTNCKEDEEDAINKMLEEELKEKFGDDVEFIEEYDEDEEWEDGEWEYEYEDEGEYDEDEEWEYEDDEGVEGDVESSEDEEIYSEDEDLLNQRKGVVESGERTVEDLVKEQNKQEERERKLRNKAVDKKNTYLNEVVIKSRYLLRSNILADDMENGICWECWKVYFPDENWPPLKEDK